MDVRTAEHTARIYILDKSNWCVVQRYMEIEEKQENVWKEILIRIKLHAKEEEKKKRLVHRLDYDRRRTMQ